MGPAFHAATWCAPQPGVEPLVPIFVGEAHVVEQVPASHCRLASERGDRRRRRRRRPRSAPLVALAHGRDDQRGRIEQAKGGARRRTDILRDLAGVPAREEHEGRDGRRSELAEHVRVHGESVLGPDVELPSVAVVGDDEDAAVLDIFTPRGLGCGDRTIDDQPIQRTRTPILTLDVQMETVALGAHSDSNNRISPSQAYFPRVRAAPEGYR